MRKELLKTRAYGIFLDELTRHLEFTKKKIIENEVISEGVFREAKEIFHTLKGSSGFFGFDGLRATSSELEKHFSRSLEEVVCDMNEIRDLIKKIEDEAKELPAAKADKREENA